jgi:fermentation-respiration switch protein FrsA (DUF1100 family)
MSVLFRLLLLIAGFAVTAYLAICLLLYFRQTRLIFFPTATIETTPADLGMPYEDVWLPVQLSQRSERIHGWWIPASSEAAGVLLYLHGNGMNIGANVGHAKRFHQLGLSVLLIDYRGYGRSEGGFPTEQQVYQDAEASWRYLTQTRQISPESILLYGHSLGGAVAIDLAVHQSDAAGLIVQSSFTSIRDMVDHTSRYRFFPVEQLLHQRFDSIRKVPFLKMPVLFIHGLADIQVPATMSEALYAATPDPKQLYLVPLAGHNNVADTAGAEYLKVVQQFVEQCRQRVSVLSAEK